MELWGVEERYVVIYEGYYELRSNADGFAVVDRLAAFLENLGVKKGDTIAVYTTNSPEMYVTAMALSKLSAVAGLVNINLRGESRTL